jgi:hypothetical protein
LSFKVGDVVKVIKPFWESVPDDSRIGRVGVITEKSGNSYFVGYFDGYTNGWWDEDKLKLIVHCPKAIDTYEQIADLVEKRNKDMRYITHEYPDISSMSVEYLLNEVGFGSSFRKTGEYALLFSEWMGLKPIYDCLFDGDHDGMHDLIDSMLDGRRAKFDRLYDRVKQIRGGD